MRRWKPEIGCKDNALTSPNVEFRGRPTTLRADRWDSSDEGMKFRSWARLKHCSITYVCTKSLILHILSALVCKVQSAEIIAPRAKRPALTSTALEHSLWLNWATLATLSPQRYKNMSRNASDYVRVCQRCSHTARMKVSWSNIKLCDVFPCVPALSLEADREVRGHCFTGSHVDGPTSMMVVISLPPHMHGHKRVHSMLPDWRYTYIHTHLRANVKFSNSQLPPAPLCRGAAVGSFPCRSKLWEERKSTRMKTAVSLWENTPHCKALLPPPPPPLLLLLHCHGNGGESMCWSQSLKVTQYLHVLIISAPYEKNITSLVSMMKIRIRSLQSVHCFSNEQREPAIKVKTRKWTARILVSLAKMQVDEAWFQPVTGVYYFWLGLFKRDKIGQNYWCVSSLESKELGGEERGWEFKEGWK